MEGEDVEVDDEDDDDQSDHNFWEEPPKLTKISLQQHEPITDTLV